MRWPYNLEECLRTIGYLADELGLVSPVIEESDHELVVREGAVDAPVSPYLHFSPDEVAALVAKARARRGGGPSSGPTDHEQRLRVVGRQLDERRAQTVRLELKEGTVAASYFRLGQERANEAFSDRYLRLMIDQAVRRRQGPAA